MIPSLAGFLILLASIGSQAQTLKWDPLPIGYQSDNFAIRVHFTTNLLVDRNVMTEVTNRISAQFGSTVPEIGTLIVNNADKYFGRGGLTNFVIPNQLSLPPLSAWTTLTNLPSTSTELTVGNKWRCAFFTLTTVNKLTGEESDYASK